MFDMLKPGKGYAMTLANGTRIEVDFGPMSQSEKVNSSQKECDVSPQSRDAEIRIYEPGSGVTPSFIRGNSSVDDLADIMQEFSK